MFERWLMMFNHCLLMLVMVNNGSHCECWLKQVPSHFILSDVHQKYQEVTKKWELLRENCWFHAQTCVSTSCWLLADGNMIGETRPHLSTTDSTGWSSRHALIILGETKRPRNILGYCWAAVYSCTVTMGIAHRPGHYHCKFLHNEVGTSHQVNSNGWCW